MKKTFLLLIFISITTFAFAQSVGDTAKVLQLCVDLPELQKDFPKDDNGISKPLYIMQYPIVIPTDISLKKFGKSPIFMTRHEMYDNNIEAFFLFKQINILDDSAFVDYSFYYDYNEVEQKVLHIKMNCIYKDDEWQIGEYLFELK